MGPRGPHPSKNSEVVSPVGILWIENVAPARVSVPAKEYSWGTLSDGSYRVFPDRGLLPSTFGVGRGQYRLQISPSP